ncbi:hypothetical protein PSQ39_07790 [Curvibacter sp. HBC28]|uniref:Uncharacterized protein n=1 Tax=Curvibacter microcysteis TaxID=3026419 RepID=A0ABT5MD63_9BURK|nr:hypothetical protein [Curvibacter sp. HBC28]MDD0814526.1 hypothetical protein [Curvibacter sp. HBC28]
MSTFPPLSFPSRPEALDKADRVSARIDQVLGTTAAQWGLAWPLSAPSRPLCPRPSVQAQGALQGGGSVRVRRRMNRARRAMAQALAYQPVSAWSLKGLAW